MPHSGGGGSHGGGSHGGGSHGGGSHGGSSARTSHHYFPGSRRFRRHYYDGRADDYFYSDRYPQKMNISSIVLVCFFMVVFALPMIFFQISGKPRKLDENYLRPESYIIDNIGVIDNDAELTATLKTYNDLTGICPVVYTLYTEDYKGNYVDLESFAYYKYLELFKDERHYLLVYAIPRSQASSLKSGTVPDFEWEMMIGDDTDKLYSETTFVRSVHSGLESGEAPGNVFNKAMNRLYASSEAAINKVMFWPLLIVFAVFAIPIIIMINQYRKEKNFEYEEVPLEKSDIYRIDPRTDDE